MEHGRNITRSRTSEIEEAIGSGDDRQLPKREKRRRSSNAALESPSTASATGISSWFPWSKSPRTSFDANSTAGVDGLGEGLHRRNGEAVTPDVSAVEEEGWSSSSSSSSDGEDAGGGRAIREGEWVEKFSARGETVLGA